MGTKKLLEDVALGMMESVAERFEIENGVGFVLLLETEALSYPRIAFFVIGLIERDPDPSRGEDDTGTNYFAVAMSKLARMISTEQDSGLSTSPLKYGEVPCRGGLIRVVLKGTILTGFSGGTEDQDVLVAQAGMDILLA